MHVELISDRAAFDRLAPAWNALLAEDSSPPHGMDATGSFEWASALLDSFLQDGNWLVAVAADPDGVAGILPLYRPTGPRGLCAPRELALFTESYGGRNGFLVRGGDPDILRRLVEFLHREVQGWDCLRLHLVRGSRSDAMLATLVAQMPLAGTEIARETSPVLMLPDDFEAWAATLKPSFRTELRRRERRLRDAGDLRFELFTQPADVERYWDAVIAIERQSWKEAAGSSITRHPEQDRFYRAMLPRAAAAGQWLSALLCLDGRPVAYRLSIADRGVALGLKTSFVDDLRKFAPASLLQWMYLRRVHDLGIRCFDFSGNAEEHKMQWTSETYTLDTMQLFRPSLGGNLARVRGFLAGTARRLKERA